MQNSGVSDGIRKNLEMKTTVTVDRPLWSTGPVTAFLWKAEEVKITSGAEHIRPFEKIPRSQHQFCNVCGRHLMLAVPSLGLVNIFASTMPALEFEPVIHVDCA